MTRAPDQTASSIAACPTAPAPPATSTSSPEIGPSASKQWYAVNAGIPSEAPSSNDAEEGSATACADATTQNGAAVPHCRCHAAKYTHTREPTREASTPDPTASITPAASCPGTWKANGTSAPARDFQSVGFTPATTTRTRTSPGPGEGVGTSSTTSTPDDPGAV